MRSRLFTLSALLALTLVVGACRSGPEGVPPTPAPADMVGRVDVPSEPQAPGWRVQPEALGFFRDTEVRFEAQFSATTPASWRYEWNFGDGSPTATGPHVNHVYAGGHEGHTVTLRVLEGSREVARMTRHLPVLAAGASYPSRLPGLTDEELDQQPRPAGEELGKAIPIDDPTGHAMDALYAALQRAAKGEGRARLSFFGASHVASDLFTREIRHGLRARFGDAGAGFVLPARPWKRYRGGGLHIDSSDGWASQRVRVSTRDVDFYGLAGTFVESASKKDWGTIEPGKGTGASRYAGVYDVFYLAHPQGGSFDVYVDGRRIKRVKTRSRLLEPRYELFTVPDGPHQFKVRPRGDGLVRLFGVAVERNEPGVIVDTLGINGSRARYQLLWDDRVYREHLWRVKPDLVVLAYGTNESGDDSPIDKYVGELDRVLTRLREAAPQASCLLIGPSDHPVVVRDEEEEEQPVVRLDDRARTQKVIAVQRHLAAKHGCGFFDIVAFQGGPMSMVDWVRADPPMAQRDYVHFTVRGYRRLGKVLLKNFVEGYEDWVERTASP